MINWHIYYVQKAKTAQENESESSIANISSHLTADKTTEKQQIAIEVK